MGKRPAASCGDIRRGTRGRACRRCWLAAILLGLLLTFDGALDAGSATFCQLGGPARPIAGRLAPQRSHARQPGRSLSRVYLRAQVKDPWKVLGVEPGASPQEIKRAYRRKALKEHPDVNKAPEAKERWQELSAAYEILSDPGKQKLWEEAKRQEAAGGGRARSSSWGGGGRRGAAPKGPRQQAMDEKYDSGGDSLGSIFGDILEGLGREVGGDTTGPVGRARKVGGFVLEELLDFLEGKGSRGSGRSTWDEDANMADQLRFAREELASLEQLDKTLVDEAATFEKQAEAAKAAGDSSSEVAAMTKVFDARDRRKSVRRRLLRAEENVEYLEKVTFEYERKRQGRAQGAQDGQGRGGQSQGGASGGDSPGRYTITYDQAKISSTLELSDKIVGSLGKGAIVEVVEVVERPEDKRVRGRLASPAGWISLANMETGFRWAARDPASAGGAGPSAGSRQTPYGYSAPPKKPDFDADAALAELKKSKSGR